MTGKPVRIGVQIAPQQADYAAIRDAVLRVEDAGVDVVFNWDHFFPLRGDPEGRHFECWTMLSAWAEQTSRVELGPLVSCNSFRNPDLVADMARTVDHISDGRLILGLGAGWFERDYLEYGYEFGTPGARLASLRANMPRILDRLDRLNPLPVRPVPILNAGGGERKTLRIAAEHADIWHSASDPEALARKTALLRGYCAEIGRDFDEIEVAVNTFGADPAESGAVLVDLGARLFIVAVDGPDYDLTSLSRWLAWRDAWAGR